MRGVVPRKEKKNSKSLFHDLRFLLLLLSFKKTLLRPSAMPSLASFALATCVPRAGAYYTSRECCEKEAHRDERIRRFFCFFLLLSPSGPSLDDDGKKKLSTFFPPAAERSPWGPSNRATLLDAQCTLAVSPHTEPRWGADAGVPEARETT